MGKFIKKLVYFISFVLFLLGINGLLNLTVQHEFKISEQKIGLGNSHMECALNPEFIPNFKNLASSGEAFLYTYLKLKHLVRFNPEITTLYLEVNSSNFYSKKQLENSWEFESSHIYNHLPPNISELSLDEICLFLQYNPLIFLKIAFMKAFWLNPREVKGRYLGLDTNFVVKPKEENLKGVRQAENQIQIEFGQKYLNKIIALAEAQNIKIQLVHVPELDADTLIKQVGRYKLTYFKDFPLKEEFFKDNGHLNIKGANLFSKEYFYPAFNNKN